MMKLCTGSKNEMLFTVLRQAGFVGSSGTAATKALVFCATKKCCEGLSQVLWRGGVSCSAIHGDRSQADREKTLGDLRAGKIRLVIATDVAARGLDIKGITLVVNYDMPHNPSDYVHRIGRTGRAG